MASTPYIHGQALGTIAWGTSSFAGTAEIQDIKWAGFKRESLDTTAMGTVGLAIANGVDVQDTGVVASPVVSPGTYPYTKTFLPSAFVDPGEITLVCFLNANLNPLVNAAAMLKETVTLKLGPIPISGTTQASWTGIAAMLDFSFDAPVDGKVVTATFKVKFSGPILVTAAA